MNSLCNSCCIIADLPTLREVFSSQPTQPISHPETIPPLHDKDRWERLRTHVSGTLITLLHKNSYFSWSRSFVCVVCFSASTGSAYLFRLLLLLLQQRPLRHDRETKPSFAGCLPAPTLATLAQEAVACLSAAVARAFMNNSSRLKLFSFAENLWDKKKCIFKTHFKFNEKLFKVSIKSIGNEFLQIVS